MDAHDITKIYNDIQNYTVSTDSGNSQVNYTLTGYTTVQTISNEAFLNSDTTFVNLDNLSSIVNVTQPNPRKLFNCNFSFNIDFSVNVKLPKLIPDSPDFSLLYKIDTFSKEVTNINDDLIRAIRSLNCCDIEYTYNKKIVPFFRWFADSKDSNDCGDGTNNCGAMFGSDTFPTILLDIANPLIQIYIIVKPFACLVRPLPGNPWFPWDFDLLKYFRFILDYFDMYIDYIISGKIMDPLIDIVSDIRKKLDNCISGTPENDKTLTDKNYQNLINRFYFISLLEKNKVIYKTRIDKLKSKKVEINKKIAQIKDTLIFFVEKTEDVSRDYNLILASMNLKLLDSNNSVYKTAKIYDFFNIIEISSSSTLVTEYEKLKIIINMMTADNLKNYLVSYLGLTNTINLNNWIAITEYGSSDSNTPVADFLYAYLKAKFNDLLNFYNELEQVDNSIKSITEILKSYDKEIQKYQQPSKNKVEGSLSRNYHEVSLKNTLSNYSANICNCLLHTLLPDASYPKPIFLQDYSMNELSQIKGHADTEIKKADIIDNPCLTDIKNISKSNQSLFYCENFIEKLNIGFTQDINFAVSDFLKLKYNDAPISDLSKMFIENFNNKLNEIQNTTSENVSTSDFIKSYLTQINKYSSKHNKIVQRFDVESETFDVPYSNNTINIKIPSPAFLSQISDNLFNLENLDSFQSYKLKITYIAASKACDNYISDIAISIDNIIAIDQKNFKETVDKVNAILNLINIKIKNNLINFTKIEQLNDPKIYSNYIDFIRKYIDNYHFYDFENDPQDLSIQYIKSYKPNFINIELSEAANEIQSLFNSYLEKRKDLIINNYAYFIQYNIFKNKIKKVIDIINQNPLNYIHIVTIKANIDINPCSCDIFCKVIQYIIDKLLSIVSLLMQMLINMILDWIMKSWIGKLINLIIAKINCLLDFLNIDDNLNQLKNLTDSIDKALKGRIQLYKDPSICGTINAQTDTDLSNIINNIESNNNLIPTLTTNNDTNIDNNSTIIVPPDPVADADVNISDNNIGNTKVDISSDGNTTQILLNGNQNLYQPPLIPDSVAQSLPATLITTDSIEVGVPNNHGFPLLSFNCNCDNEECKDCKDNTKVENTIKFFNQV